MRLIRIERGITMKKLLAFFIATIFFIISLVTFNAVLEKRIASEYTNRISLLYGDTTKNRGLALQTAGINKDDNLMVYGSSELGTDIPQNPRYFFPRQNAPFVVNVIGRGYAQDLQHAINFGALSQDLKGKKVIFVLSLQWFMNPQGITPDNFKMNFSPLQFYQLMKSSTISQGLKHSIAERVYQLTQQDQELKSEALYTRLYISQNPLARFTLTLMQPYYSMKYYALETKDNIRSYQLIKQNQKEVSTDALKLTNWDQEMKNAETQAETLTNKNPFYIENSYFDQYYRPDLDQFKDIYKDVNLNSSQEFDDLKLLLEICKENDINPLFVLMPVNGRWYDYEGLGSQERQQFYQKVDQMIQSKGFKTANFSGNEYEKHFMIDGMHLGWKGWLYVDQSINQFYKED